MITLADKLIQTDRATIPVDKLQHVSYEYLTNIEGKKEVKVKLYTANPNPVIQVTDHQTLVDFLHYLKLEKMGLSE